MAVHDDVPGIEVTVRIDGQTVKEYEAENDVSLRCSHFFHLSQKPNARVAAELFSMGYSLRWNNLLRGRD